MLIGLFSDIWTDAVTRWKQEHSATVPVEALALVALEVAREELGRGELGANNAGPDVAKYRGDDKHAAWCAAFVCWCFEEAARRLGVPMPFKRSHGAKRCYRIIGNAGAFVDLPMPGDVACWHRGAAGSWMGHVALVDAVDGDLFSCIEGNRGRFPSRVARFDHELGEPNLIGFARAPSLLAA